MPPREVMRLVGAASEIAPLIIRRVADIEAQPVRWLWPGRIARGKVTMLAGHPGLGKSQLALDVAAIVTAGREWPVDGICAERGSAIILSAEDDPADTIRPRLEAAGADLARCHVVDAAQDIGDDGKPRRRGFSLVDDLARLDAELRRIGDVAVVVIDPVTAYLGATDSHHNAEVRAILAPLADLAAQHSVAVLAISHLRKSVAGDAVLQVTGSLAFAAAARAVYIVARDPDDRARRLMLPAKNNIGEDRTGYGYAPWLRKNVIGATLVVLESEPGESLPPATDAYRKPGWNKSRRRKPCCVARRVGRPSGFRPELAKIAYRVCLLGSTDQQLADCLGISAETLYAWKISYPEFREAIARGKTEVDANVAESLYRRAIGYDYETVKVFKGAPEGPPVVVRYIEHLPPDVRAAELWLTNRQPGRWRERRDIEMTLTLEQKIGAMTPLERTARLLELEAKLAAPAIEGEASEVEKRLKMAKPHRLEVGGRVDSTWNKLF